MKLVIVSLLFIGLAYTGSAQVGEPGDPNGPQVYKHAIPGSSSSGSSSSGSSSTYKPRGVHHVEHQASHCDGYSKRGSWRCNGMPLNYTVPKNNRLNIPSNTEVSSDDNGMGQLFAIVIGGILGIIVIN